jgi:hypothetical protein
VVNIYLRSYHESTVSAEHRTLDPFSKRIKQNGITDESINASGYKGATMSLNKEKRSWVK